MMRFQASVLRSTWMMFGLMGLVFTTGGATCVPKRPISEFQPPNVFTAPPDIQQIAEVLNRSRAIQQLQSNAVTIRVPGAPVLSARMVWERPRRFRMTGGVSLVTGTVFDLGSNDEVFWMATRHGPSPTLYYARHDQFATQMERQILPVSPEWLIEALGIIELDPSTVIGTPSIQADGQMEIESTLASPIGQYRRTITVDPKSAVVRRVLLRDPTGRLLATSILSDHEYYSAIRSSLPRRIQAQLIPTGSSPMDLRIDVGSYSLNNNQGQDPERWTPPNSAGYTVYDLVQLNGGQPLSVRSPEYQPAALGVPQVSYRGVSNNF